MDSKRFDALSRSLATAGTRRGLVRWLSTLSVTGVLLTMLTPPSEAGKRQHHHPDHQHHRDRKRHDTHGTGASRRDKPHPKGSRRDKQQATGQLKGAGEKCSRGGQCVSQRCNRKKGARSGRCLPGGVNERCRLDTDCSAGLSCLKATGASPDEFGLCQAGRTCIPESEAQTCAGRCGTVSNNCGTQVDCGSCACGSACPVCQTCNATMGRCETNLAFVAQACGLPGQICQADGTCVCDEASCADGQRCNGLVCICDAASCPTGCCDGSRTCRIGDDAACGTDGGNCTRCTGTGVTCGGGGAPGQCGCTPQGCGNQTCGSTVDNCGHTIPCGGCTGCCDGNSCRDGTSLSACGADGVACQICSGICDASRTCAACSPSAPCPSGMCCNGGICVASCPACQTCIDGVCANDTAKNRTSCQLPANGGTGICCKGSCCAGCCDARVENGTCSPCLAFVTSTATNGNLGGLIGADRTCQGRAEAGGFSGSYKAWLSSPFDSPSSRFRCTRASCSSQGYERVDGLPIASDWVDLTTCDGDDPDTSVCLANPLNVTELGDTVSLVTSAWTHTGQNGEQDIFPNSSCQNWTADSSSVLGRVGQPEVTSPRWTNSAPFGCQTLHSLYCFQQT